MIREQPPYIMHVQMVTQVLAMYLQFVTVSLLTVLDIVDWILKEIKKLDNSNFKNLINITNNKGNTPLHWAAFKGHVDTVQLLLDYGASTTVSYI